MTPKQRWSRQLPAELTTFVGRAADLAALGGLIVVGRLVTLTGPGGVGKTRLALHYASSVADQFADGVVFVDLSDLTSGDLVASTIARRLGLTDDVGRASADLVASYLGERNVLLILDNCEHVLSACAAVVGEVLRCGDSVQVLATSRQPLSVPGEYVQDVRPLDVPPPEATELSAIERYDAVQLLVQRAAAASPGFGLTADNAVHVRTLCTRLDGLPLAIELAAVRLRALSADQLVQHLDRRFRVLSAGTVTPARQRTLDALVTWSYDLCDPAEQLLWARLSVFPATFDITAATAVCADESLDGNAVFELVPALVDKSILAVAGRGDGGDRYRMLETIRAYGLQKFDGPEDLRRVRERHRGHYVQLTAGSNVNWPCLDASDPDVLTQQDLPNFRAALQYCLDDPQEHAAGLELAALLWLYWRTSGHFAEGRRWYHNFLDAVPQPTPARARALWATAWLASLQGDFADAEDKLTECEEVAALIGDRAARACATDVRGLGLLLRGDYKAATVLLNEALEGHIESGDRVSRLICLHRIAQASLGAGDPEQARDLARECVDACKESASWLALHAQWILGISLWRLGDAVSALEIESDVAALSLRHGDRLGLTLGAQAVSWVASTQRDDARAARLVGAIERAWTEVGAHFAARGFLFVFHQACTESIALALGEAKFGALRAEGALFDDDALLAEIQAVVAGAPADPGISGPLTAREGQIAGMIVRGLTNAAIAQQLVISRRTVDTHVQNMFTKLEVNSRAQLAAWMTANVLDRTERAQAVSRR